MAKTTKELERIYHFEYQGKSTDTILDSCPLWISFVNEIGELGTTLEKIEGNATISKPRTNEYGTQPTPLSFELGLMKQNEQPFTTEEAMAIERWLTSPLYSSELKIESCKYTIINVDDNNITTTTEEYDDTFYSGLFLRTTWERGSQGLYFCTATFQCRDAYPYQKQKFISSNSGSSYTMNLTVNSDELERYVYPIIRITPRTTASDSSFKIIQNTDNGNSVEVKTTLYRSITLDCRHCMAYFCTGESSGYQRVRDVTFKELGWDKTDTIYWPRFIPGQNTIQIIGDVDVVIEVQPPIKKVGGWLL